MVKCASIIPHAQDFFYGNVYATSFYNDIISYLADSYNVVSHIDDFLLPHALPLLHVDFWIIHELKPSRDFARYILKYHFDEVQNIGLLVFGNDEPIKIQGRVVEVINSPDLEMNTMNNFVFTKEMKKGIDRMVKKKKHSTINV